jgi:hypothetical protein
LWENFFTFGVRREKIVLDKSGLVSECHLADQLIASEGRRIPHPNSDGPDDNLRAQKNRPRGLA